jgi:hypothetical protein
MDIEEATQIKIHNPKLNKWGTPNSSTYDHLLAMRPNYDLDITLYIPTGTGMFETPKTVDALLFHGKRLLAHLMTCDACPRHWRPCKKFSNIANDITSFGFDPSESLAIASRNSQSFEIDA